MAARKAPRAVNQPAPTVEVESIKDPEPAPVPPEPKPPALDPGPDPSPACGYIGYRPDPNEPSAYALTTGPAAPDLVPDDRTQTVQHPHPKET